MLDFNVIASSNLKSSSPFKKIKQRTCHNNIFNQPSFDFVTFGNTNKIIQKSFENSSDYTKSNEFKNLSSNNQKLILVANKNIPTIEGEILQKDNTSVDDIKKSINNIEIKTSRNFGQTNKPLIISLENNNKTTYLGFNSQTANSLIKEMPDSESNKIFVYDCYKQSILSLGINVLDIDPNKFNEKLKDILEENNLSNYNEINSEILSTKVIPAFKEIIQKETGKAYPENVTEQIDLYNKSTKNNNCTTIKPVPFTNLNDKSGIGICYSRNTDSSNNELETYFIQNATAQNLLEGQTKLLKTEDFKTLFPQEFEKFEQDIKEVEKTFKKPQVVNFVIDNGKIKITDIKDKELSPQEKIKTAVKMNKEGIMTDEDAINYIDIDDLQASLSTKFKQSKRDEAIQQGRLISKGKGASSGATSGIIVFNTLKAKELIEKGKNVILVKSETNADDVEVMLKAKGVIAINAGPSSHAAVVARGIAKPCIVGCGDIKIVNNNTLVCGNKTFNEGDTISIDGVNGEIFSGEIPTESSEPIQEFYEFLNMADKHSPIDVYANAETPADVAKSKNFGAKGIGLARTEHMFFNADRIPIMQECILAGSAKKRVDSLNKLEKMQTKDFIDIFNLMKDKPVTIRLLDPPLHEFLPKPNELIDSIARLETELKYNPMLLINHSQKKEKEKELENKKNLLTQVQSHVEANPMLGNRGCRLGITMPEIYSMQIKAIVKSALTTNTRPKIMIPMICDFNEYKTLLADLKKTMEETVKDYCKNDNDKIAKLMKEFKFGTMIELPRAALTADQLAELADFFSFGTNDLTQSTFGFSRDDAQSFLNTYKEKGIMKNNPFEVLDKEGVGTLIDIAATKSRKVKPNFELGICGEQGGDPESIKSLIDLKVNYVSTSPYRIPAARLAAAKAGIAKPSISFTGGNGEATLQERLMSTFNTIRGLKLLFNKKNILKKMDTNIDLTKIQNPTNSFEALSYLLDAEFATTFPKLTKECNYSLDFIKDEVRKEYGKETADLINLNGDKIGFNDLLLAVPGTMKDGKVPSVFPVVCPEAYMGYMGGGHWYAELHFSNNILTKVNKLYPDFSFDNLRKEMKLDGILNNENIPKGISSQGRRNLVDKGNKYAFDENGNPNFVSIHGFLIYDSNKNAYMLLDNKPGIKEFVENNKEQFDLLNKKFNLKAVLVGGEPLELSETDKKDKEQNDFINQIRGEVYLKGYRPTTMPLNNSSEISSDKFLEILTNPKSHEKFISGT